MSELEEKFGIHRLRCSHVQPGARVNVYFAEEPVPTLIDAPPEGPSYLEELEGHLKACGVSVRDIRRVICTHAHFDHYGTAVTLKEKFGTELWFPSRAARFVENYEEELQREEVYRNLLLEKAGASVAEVEEMIAFYRSGDALAHRTCVSRYLAEGDTFELGSLAFGVTEIPGHTPFCLLFHDLDKNLAFTGDLIVRDISSNPLIQYPHVLSRGYRSLGAYIASLRKVREMNLKLALPGHGPTLHDPSKKIDAFLALIEKRRETIAKSLEKGPKTPVAIVRELFPHLDRESLFRGLSDVLGHLELLEDDGVAAREEGFPTKFRLSPGRPSR